VTDVGVEAGRETPIARFEPVAGVVHTLFLLFIIAAIAVVGYFSIYRQSAGRNPNRIIFYLTTMAWEWLIFGYVYWGLRRRGKSLKNVAGRSWKAVPDFLMDVAIAFGSWIAAIIADAGALVTYNTADFSVAAERFGILVLTPTQLLRKAKP